MPPARRKAKRERKIIVYIATSADGYIARPDGGYEWLDRPRPPENYGMGSFLRSIDTILWGRNTYDLAIRDRGSVRGFDPAIKNYVFSHRPPAAEDADVTFVRQPVKEFARRFRGEAGKNAWIMGGAGLIGSFLDAGEIEEFMIHVVPVMIGEGIPLVQPRHRLVRLRLRSSKRFEDGVVRLHYEVKRQPRRPGGRRKK